MQKKPYVYIHLLLLAVTILSSACAGSKTTDVEQIDQSKLVVIEQATKYIAWDDPDLLKAQDEWLANPSLYEPVGVMLSDRGAAEGLSLEQTIDKLHDDYEKLGVDSCYMAVMIESMASEMKMFNQKTFELNLPINPSADKVAINAVNIKPKDGYNYDDLASAIEKYLNHKIDPQEMADFVEKVDMILVIYDKDYDRLYACDVILREIGNSDGASVVKLFINSGVDGAYFEILR